MQQDTPESARGVVDYLHDAVVSFCSAVADLGDQPGRPGQWGMREVLAHLVFWHETYVAILGALVKGEETALFDGTFKELNALAVRRNAQEPLPALARRFQAAQDELERLVKLSRGQDLQVRIKQGSKARDLPQFLRAVTSHIRNHEALLRRRARSRARGPLEMKSEQKRSPR